MQSEARLIPPSAGNFCVRIKYASDDTRTNDAPARRHCAKRCGSAHLHNGRNGGSRNLTWCVSTVGTDTNGRQATMAGGKCIDDDDDSARVNAKTCKSHFPFMDFSSLGRQRHSARNGANGEYAKYV